MTYVNKPSWDDYFMHMAKLVSCRSLDPHTKHGSIIVDNNNRIISTGYNSPPKGLDDSKIPLSRPEKVDYILHSEDNAIQFAKTDLSGCTIYITGPPCPNCTLRIIQNDIKRVVCGTQMSKSVNESMIKSSVFMMREVGISVTTDYNIYEWIVGSGGVISFS